MLNDLREPTVLAHVVALPMLAVVTIPEVPDHLEGLVTLADAQPEAVL